MRQDRAIAFYRAGSDMNPGDYKHQSRSPIEIRSKLLVLDCRKDGIGRPGSSCAAAAAPLATSRLDHRVVAVCNYATVVEHAVRKVVDTRVIELLMGVVRQHLHAAAVAKIGTFS